MTMRIVVAGGGIAGSIAALLLSDAGADVTLTDPSPTLDVPPDEAWTASRSGCAQMHHTHNFLGAFWDVLRLRAPDVVEAVARAGATSGGRGTPLRVRRTTLGAVLAGALVRRDVSIRSASVRAVEPSCTGPRLLTSAGVEHADLVVDATGRRSRLADLVTESDTPAGIAYLSRHYVSKDAAPPPPAGFGRHYVAAHAVHDAGTFSCVLGVDSSRGEVRRWRSPDAFDLALSHVPGFADRMATGATRAIQDVQVMGGLRNVLRVPRTLDTRVLAIGDALATTDPSRGRGSAIAATQAACLADLVRAGVSPDALAGAYYGGALAPLRTWVADARDSSRWRASCWASGTEPAPLSRAPERRTAWEWLQTPPVDDDERRIRSDYAQMAASPDEVITAGLARGDDGRRELAAVRLPPIEHLDRRPAGACAS